MECMVFIEHNGNASSEMMHVCCVVSLFYLLLMIFMGYFCDSNIIFNAEVWSINSIIA